MNHDTFKKFPYGILRNDGLYPHPDLGKVGTPPPQNRRYPLMFQLLPFIEQQALYDWYDQFDFNRNRRDRLNPTSDWVGDWFLKQTVATMVCPSNPGGLWNESSTPADSGKYFRGHYFGCAGTRAYPRADTSNARPSLFNPFAPAVAATYTAGNDKTDGMFNRCKRYGMAEVVDGTSNTLMLASAGTLTQSLTPARSSTTAFAIGVGSGSGARAMPTWAPAHLSTSCCQPTSTRWAAECSSCCLKIASIRSAACIPVVPTLLWLMVR